MDEVDAAAVVFARASGGFRRIRYWRFGELAPAAMRRAVRAISGSTCSAASRRRAERRIRAVNVTGLRPVRWRPDHLCVNETPATAWLRRAVRAVILADDARVLLCRFSFPHPAVPTGSTAVWAAPGGGIEPGELPLAALRRELHEETGLVFDADPPHVWHQEVAAPGHADGYDGIVNDCFLVRTTRFDPRGALSDDELAAENISGMRWWRHEDIAGYGGTDLFSPRESPHRWRR